MTEDELSDFDAMCDREFAQLRLDAENGDEFAALLMERHKLAEAAIMCDELEAGRIMSERFDKRIAALAQKLHGDGPWSKTP